MTNTKRLLATMCGASLAILAMGPLGAVLAAEAPAAAPAAVAAGEPAWMSAWREAEQAARQRWIEHDKRVRSYLAEQAEAFAKENRALWEERQKAYQALMELDAKAAKTTAEAFHDRWQQGSKADSETRMKEQQETMKARREAMEKLFEIEQKALGHYYGGPWFQPAQDPLGDPEARRQALAERRAKALEWLKAERKAHQDAMQAHQRSVEQWFRAGPPPLHPVPPVVATEAPVEAH